jgi:hypothetical protein
MRCSKQQLYSITSSATESSPSAISMPSVRAVFMLMTNSKFCRPQRWRVGRLALPSLR